MSGPDLARILRRMADRADTMTPVRADRVADILSAAAWHKTITDDVRLCLLCSVQDVHSPLCPVSELQLIGAGR